MPRKSFNLLFRGISIVYCVDIIISILINTKLTRINTRQELFLFTFTKYLTHFKRSNK